MFKILLIGHILGDYYFQSDKLCNGKINSNKSLINHAIRYSIILFLISFIFYTKTFFIHLIMIVCLPHLVIDLLKIKMLSCKKISKIHLYIYDQVIHILTLFFYCYLINHSGIINYRNWINIIGNNSIANVEIYISWVLLLLVIYKPSIITIKIFLHTFQWQDTTEKYKKGSPNAGSIIGVLERILILLILTMNAYSSIGLVITAKSVARYKKISEDPYFSENYLLGTLLSTIIAVISYILIIPS